MAQNKLKWAPTSNAFQTTLNGAINATATTITLNSVSGLQNKAGILVIDRVDSSGTSTPSAREYIYFTGVSGSAVTLPSVADGRGQGGSSAQSHADGAIVEAVVDVDQWNGLVDSYDVQHNDDGTHDALTSTILGLSSNASVAGNLFANTLNVASTASVTGVLNTRGIIGISGASLRRADVGNINMPSTGSGYYQSGFQLIRHNPSNQVELGDPSKTTVLAGPLGLDVFETTTIDDGTTTASSEGTAETVAHLDFTLGVACKCLVLLHVRSENSTAGSRGFYKIQDTSTDVLTSAGGESQWIEVITETGGEGPSCDLMFITEEEPAGAHTYNVKAWVDGNTQTTNKLLLQVIPLGT